MAFIAVSLQIFWQTFYRNVLCVVPYLTYEYDFFSKPLWIWLVVMATEKLYLRKKIIIREVKLKRYRNVPNICLFKCFVLLLLLLCFRCYDNLKFPLPYNGESESRPLLLSHCRYFDRSLQKCSLSSPLPNMWILSKPLNLIGYHGNRNAKFAKNYSKLISSEDIRRLKLKLCRTVHNVSLFIAVARVL